MQRFLPIGDEAPATAMGPKADITMATEIDLNVAEVPYKSGSVRYRYSRFISHDKTRWIRHGLFVEYNEEGLTKSEGTYANGQLLRRIPGATLMWRTGARLHSTTAYDFNDETMPYGVGRFVESRAHASRHEPDI